MSAAPAGLWPLVDDRLHHRPHGRLQRQSSIIGLHGSAGGHVAGAVDGRMLFHRAIRDGKPDEAAAVHLDNTLEDYRREIQRRPLG